jgi:hypothetical protein
VFLRTKGVVSVASEDTRPIAIAWLPPVPATTCLAYEPGSPMTGLGPRRCIRHYKHRGDCEYDWILPGEEREGRG